MIPILYSKSETQFLSNGLGRLTECISCDVTEERNGIYECEFTYPVTGRFCKEMMENGGIISVTHDNHGDRQAFDIYKFSAPIDGIVTFNAHHISYRLNGIIVTPFEASTCAGALQKISQNSANTNPFTFTTDKVVTAPYIVSVPSNARSLLGGSSGSILDTYGTGEYEWDMFNVNLHLHRGQNSGVTIRYGKNLTDIVNILDKSEIYNAIAPYWTDGEHTVILPEVYLAVAGATDIICVPVDLTGDFEEKPSVSDLRSDANIYLSNINPTLANSNITIDFEALWQTTEYEDVAVLQQIGLCDTVSIYFPAIGVTQASAKAIKVVYDSLRDKYKSIEFGDAQTTLAESILGKGSSSFGDLSDGKIIGASIITAALIKAARETIGQLTLTDTLGGPDIYFDIDGYGAEGVISNNGFWFSRGPYKETIGGLLTLLVEQRTLEGHPDWLGIKFSPEKDGVSAGMATIAGFETVKDHFSDDLISYEEAYGRIIISRVKCDEDNDYAPVQVDKVIIDSENGAKMELYGSEINADVLTKIIPRKWQQFFSGSSVAVEIGNSGTKSYMILKNSSGTACVTLDTSTGAAFAIPVTATAGLTVSGGLSTDTLTTSGNASVGGDLTVTGDVTVNGVLDAKRFRCLKTLSADGWYRVLTASPLAATSGAIVKFIILQCGDVGTASANHEVTLSFNKSGINFRDESSNGIQYVTKIRVNLLSSGYAVDIYYSDTTSRTIDVFFEPYIYAPYRKRFSANSLESVADSPTGETVKAVYDFHNSGAYFNDLSVGGDLDVSGDETVGGTLDVNGATTLADATVNGVLDITPRRCYALLSSPGWYKVCTLNFGSNASVIGATGFAIDICATTAFNNNPNDTHFVSLLVAYERYYFVDEKSVSRSVCIDKIRYVNEGNGSGHIDIRYSQSVSNLVTVDFTPHIRTDYQQYIVAEPLQSVAASPSGETVLTEYTFAANITPTYLKRYVDSTAANYTIGSGGYVIVSYPSGLTGNKVVSIGIETWTSNSGPFLICPYGSTNTYWFIIGSSGTTINGIKFVYWYID